MAEIAIKPIDESHVKIVAEPSIISEMVDYFSFYTDGYKFNPKFKYGSWDGKIRLMAANGNLPYGLIDQAKKFASDMMYDIELDPSLVPPVVFNDTQFDTWLDKYEIYSGSNVIKPYWYQRDAVMTAINTRRSILNLPTSAGKSLIQALLAKWYIENHNEKILILVPTTALVDQMQADFVDYRLFTHGDMLGIRAGTEINSKAKIYVSTWQTAVKQSKEWFNQFGMLLVDECHLATGQSISNIIQKMNYCKYKIGLSGSLKDGKANILQYVGMMGKIFKPVSTAQLMEEGAVTDLKINILMLQYPQEQCIACKELDYQQEIKWLLSNKKRNQFIIKLAMKLAKTGENTIIMFKTIEHGKLLYEALKTLHNNVHYVSGDVKTEDRTEIKIQAETEKSMIIVASYGVFSTGISIKNLHNVIFAHPIKSKITVLQSIGRILRKHESKLKAVLWDIVDNLAVKTKRANSKKQYSHVNYTYKHGIDRIERYVAEEFEYSIGKIEQ